MNTPAEAVDADTAGGFSWRRALRYSAVPVAALMATSAIAAVALLTWSEPTTLPPAAADPPAGAGTTSAPTTSGSGAPSSPATAGAVRPAPGQPTRSTASGSRPATVEPTIPTSSVAAAAAPPPAGVRFSGTLQFGSFHLDPAEPRNTPGSNIWPLTPGRLHGDDGYWLAEWFGDTVPGQAECADHLTKNATRDAENLIAGSKVCGQTPDRRIFLVEVIALDSSTITGQVTVWD